MLKVGLTGGIGAGKTTVSDLFQKLDVPVIDTDVVAHRLVYPDSPALEEIIAVFGKCILDSDNKLDRKALGKIVFSNAALRVKLESILHPRIKEAVLIQTQTLHAPYCIIVVPLLLETDFVDIVDKVLVVDASDDKRVEWIEKRNGLSAQDINAVIAAQTTREARLAAADYVIVNNGTIDELNEKVLQLHNSILASCGDFKE